MEGALLYAARTGGKSLLTFRQVAVGPGQPAASPGNRAPAVHGRPLVAAADPPGGTAAGTTALTGAWSARPQLDVSGVQDPARRAVVAWQRRLPLTAGGEAAAHDGGLLGHGEPQDVIGRLRGVRRLDGRLGNEGDGEQQAAQP